MGLGGLQIHPDAWALLEVSQEHTCVSLGTRVTLTSTEVRGWGRENSLI